MQHLNKVMIAGNLGRDPAMGATPKGTLVARFSVAVNVPAKKHASARTVWFPCLALDEQAEIVEKNLSRGDFVEIEGSLDTYDPATKPGKSFRILVDRVRPAPRRTKPAEWQTATPALDASGSLPFDFTPAH